MSAPAPAVPAAETLAKDREMWLTNAADLICDDLLTDSVPGIPGPRPRFRVSVGFAKGRESAAPAASFPADASSDQTVEIFVNPRLDDPRMILPALTHELIHAYTGDHGSHRGAFQRIAYAVGFRRPLTAPHPTARLEARLTEIAADIGAYPHARLDPAAGRGKGRMRKIACNAPGCGFIAYTSAKWVARLSPDSLCPICEDGFIRPAPAPATPTTP